MKKWGIIGTGNIAHQLADAIKMLDDAKVVAVLSRSMGTAKTFADEYQIEKCFDSIDEFLSFSEIEIVYIATPHPKHYHETIACLKAGKHVLCEKPMALNSQQVNEMIKVARDNKRFLMEAMWTQFFPAMIKARELVQNGAIGEIRHIDASFCFRIDFNPQARHFNPELGGGALLDVGIYPIYFAQMFMEQLPVKIGSMAGLGATGVDEQSMYIFQYKNGAMASLKSALRTYVPQLGAVYGTTGYIEIPKFWQPDELTLHANNEIEHFHYERLGNGYTYEVQEVHRCIDAAKLQSDIISHRRSIEVADIMDEIRKQWGLVYPGEQA